MYVWQMSCILISDLYSVTDVYGKNHFGLAFGDYFCVSAFAATTLQDHFVLKIVLVDRTDPIKKLLAITFVHAGKTLPGCGKALTGDYVGVAAFALVNQAWYAASHFVTA